MSRRPIPKRLRVCVVTGTRAEFGIWRPVLQAIRQSPRLDLRLVVTGVHLLKEFGHTVNDIEESGLPIAARVPMYPDSAGKNPEADAAHSLARGIDGLAAAYRQLRPGIVMLLGDRLEMLAAAGAALARRLPIAHLHGGETAPGIWDEQIRHAITKMAHVHFCATETAGRRILRMGEPTSRVHVVGAPALDRVEEFWTLNGEIASRVRRYRRMGKRCPAAVVLLHPSGGTAEEEYARARRVLAVVTRRVPEVDAIGPNNDPGHEGIVRALQDSGVRWHMNVAQDRFWHLVVNSSVLVGNSSSGIIEAASLGVPVVNIGTRQAGRERNANVIDVGWDEADITRGLTHALQNDAFRRRAARRENVYGDGRASQRIVAVLEQLAQEGILLEKRFAE